LGAEDLIETFLYEFEERNKQLVDWIKKGDISGDDFYTLAIDQLERLKQADPMNRSYVSRQAELYHLDGHLRRAGEGYRKVLEMDPLHSLSDQEREWIEKFCPLLLINAKECFSLIDVVAVHHPSQPMIGYHLFWEDDYDFPDDNEPCDHEEIWVQYDPAKEEVKKVMSWFHARIIESEEAVLEARNHGQRSIVRIEWGKHGSLLCGWEQIKDPITHTPLKRWLRETYHQVKTGGRVPDHPLKRFWPRGFEGTFAEYIDFSVPLDPLKWLQKKPLLFKTEWVNAVLHSHALPYNFHPKMEWPDRFRC
jgi:hypothetical protein